jgi:hypothetical protein
MTIPIEGMGRPAATNHSLNWPWTVEYHYVDQISTGAIRSSKSKVVAQKMRKILANLSNLIFAGFHERCQLIIRPCTFIDEV